MSSDTSSPENLSGEFNLLEKFRNTVERNPAPHYAQNGMECIDALEAMMNQEEFLAYCRGAAVKYLWRAPHKGCLVQDLKKARCFIDFALDALGENDG